ncbi:hypothetical protein [Sphingobacterium yanglingense]|uniref:Uncharacterized protein n=1 Tax=Sphingobacterium yanglingense TaxID=1437280 RepID=A0A4R6W873_9SPHI|nr:hypothetical protein [Sphingobacterium yanglingense]TDQ73816.1 hypothetical protein CLV99_4253 [Sphingobacterium yanglingense]
MNLLENISWMELLLFLGIAIVIYYAVIIIRFKIDPTKIIGSEKDIKRNVGSDLQIPDEEIADEENEIKELEELVQMLKKDVLEAGGKGQTKAELLNAISHMVRSYSGLQKPAFRYALINFIIYNANEICAIQLEEDEVEMMLDHVSHSDDGTL